MNKTFSRISMTTGLLVIGLLGALPAMATTVLGNLGDSASATDLYTFRCPAKTTSARFRARETSDPDDNTKLSLRLIHTNKCADTEPVPAKSGDYSEWAISPCGQGTYFATVSKNAKGVEDYTAQLICRSVIQGHLANVNPTPNPISPNPDQ